ncbi:MAG: hypothetical protein NT051_06510 [Candidatus Micrarchaeota archaeon]|nr:hypothetical protein [Candidatus Micrarchaeota archaeon]
MPPYFSFTREVEARKSETNINMSGSTLGSMNSKNGRLPKR